ncbi:MAG: DNA translocase FtsK 4TM domain-containing protein [Desulfobacteraceae bacterium]|nr:DNA translocase FtsK 4TM domain-containing protein [Desulfobacteraceae bacterium]MCF8095825.1 DNA translocase FtsK 4TM domain-containing protein [Desulfobacteraceae bacterium]
MTIRREITGIFIFFLVIFSAISLASFSPVDPSFNHAVDSGGVENFFGLAGAYAAGLMVSLFGVGAFWIPVLLLLSCIRLYTHDSRMSPWLAASGGILLLVGTGAIAALFEDSYVIFGTEYAAGGMVARPAAVIFQEYANRTGAFIVLILILAIGFILTTGISLIAATRNGFRLTVIAWSRVILIFRRCLYRIRQLRLPRFDWFRRKTKKQSSANGLAGKTESSENPVPSSEKKPKASSQVRIQEPAPSAAVAARAPRQQVLESMKLQEGFHLPPLDFLEDPGPTVNDVDHEYLQKQSKILEQKLLDFGVQGSVTEVLPGPVITRYEFSPAPGIKINKIVNLSDDLALALKALSVRIIAPIPGKAVIGIEIPNKKKELVGFKNIVGSSVFQKSASKLTIALGKDIVGYPVTADLQTMPHLLIAGATGTGKSVALNTMIASVLYKASPEEVKFIMIDPKRIELANYDGIPHLIAPVVTDMKKATNALFWAVREMERRYRLLSEKRVRNIEQYNAKIAKETVAQGEPPPEKLPYVVVIVDELSDLMMVSSRDVEVSLTRLAQMARAAGIHLILATQRPSVDVLTGLIKANFPTRISFQVSSKIDSRTIIDTSGAETLLGDGDMLFLPPGTAKLQRIHGAFVSEEEVTKIIEFLKEQKAPKYDYQVIEAPEPDKKDGGEEDYDERYDEAVALVTRTGQASISMVQRHLRIGYNRAARMIELMEKEGVVGPSDGVKPREVLVRKDY